MATESNSTLQPLSLERVTEMFDREGWKYDLTGTQSMQTGFSGIGMQIIFQAPSLMFVSTAAVDVVTGERYHEVLNWVEEYNKANAYPTLSALRNDEKNVSAVGATYALPGNWEYTQEQFEKHVATGIQGMVTAARDFLGHFAPEVLAQLPE